MWIGFARAGPEEPTADDRHQLGWHGHPREADIALLDDVWR
jgi:hypothetical protein